MIPYGTYCVQAQDETLHRHFLTQSLRNPRATIDTNDHHCRHGETWVLKVLVAAKVTELINGRAGVRLTHILHLLMNFRNPRTKITFIFLKDLRSITSGLY